MNTDDESVNLCVLDPPYFSTGYAESGDRQFKTESDYLAWYKSLLRIIDLKSNLNCSFYLFHNDESIMTDVLYFIKNTLKWKIRNHIIWNKIESQNRFSRAVKTYGSNRKYGQTFSEHVWYITKQDDFFNTPFSRIIVNEMKKRGLKQKDISALEKSKNNNVTGWVHNKIKGTQIPTYKQWDKICGLFGITNEYTDLLNIYNNERYRFNQPSVNWVGRNVGEQKEILQHFGEVWNFPIVPSKIHPNQKPYDMVKHIVLTSSNNGDLVLDPFMGSGVTARVCANEERRFIGYESNLKHFENIKGSLDGR